MDENEQKQDLSMSSDYMEGLRDGKIQAIEHMQLSQNRRLDNHDIRISNLERVSYIVLGIVLFLEFAPHLKLWFN